MEGRKGNPLTVDCLAAETEQGADDAAGLPSRLDRYSKARQRALDMESFARDAKHVKEADKLSSCGQYLLFRHYFTIDKVRLHAAEFCKQHLLCPLCAIRRGAKLLQAYLKSFEVILARSPDLKPYLVTFTVKNGSDLKERMAHVRKGLQFLHKARHRGRGVSEVEKAQAGVWSYEVTNKGKGWHPHAHAVWLCSSPPDQEKLREEWKAITGDSFMVDVRPFSNDPVRAFCEVFKYAVKFSDLPESLTFEAYEALKGSRLVASFGDFRGIEIPEEFEDETFTDDLPFIDMLYRFVRGQKGQQGWYSYTEIKRKMSGSPLDPPFRRNQDSKSSDELPMAIKRHKLYQDSSGRIYMYSFCKDDE